MSRLYVRPDVSRYKLLTTGFIATLIAVPALLSACDSGSTSQNPASDLERGKQVYARYCNVCHPGGGAGSGPALTPLTPKLSDEQIRLVVRTGKNRMPGYKETDISEAELGSLIAYLRSLK